MAEEHPALRPPLLGRAHPSPRPEPGQVLGVVAIGLRERDSDHPAKALVQIRPAAADHHAGSSSKRPSPSRTSALLFT